MNMREPTTAWDRGPTDRELKAFYGTSPDYFEVEAAITRQTNAIEADDVANVVHEHFDLVMAAIKKRDPFMLMGLFRDELKTLVARRASEEVYQDNGVIKAASVLL